jgi:hypothetical protein
MADGKNSLLPGNAVKFWANMLKQQNENFYKVGGIYNHNESQYMRLKLRPESTS